jgi:hypothetical protein
MKSLCKVILLVAMSLLFVIPVEAQWIQTNGPKVIQGITAITGIPNGSGGMNLLIGGGNGIIYYSTDLGISWNSANSPNNPIWTFFATSGSEVFVGTGYDGIWKSTDHGLNWQSSSVGLPHLEMSSVSSVCLNSVDTILFSSCHTDTLYVSKNRGASWSSSSNGLNTTYSVSNVVANGTIIFAGTYGDGVFYSIDTGATWASRNIGITNNSILDMTVMKSNLYAGTGGAGIFKSTNDGLVWTPVNNNLGDLYVVSLYSTDSILIAGTASGQIFYSNDQGTNWNSIGALHSSVNDIFVYADNRFVSNGMSVCAVTSSNGAFFTPNFGSLWLFMDAVPQSYVGARTMLVRGSKIFAGDVYGNGFFMTTDNGGSWTRNPGSISAYAIYSSAMNSSVLIVGATTGALISTDEGNSWVDNGSIGSTDVFSLAANDTLILAGTLGSYAYISTDNGTSWSQKNNGLIDANVYSVAIVGGRLIAGTTSNGIFISTDKGGTWVQSNTGLGNMTGRSLYYDGTKLFAGTYAGVYYSTNYGDSWIIDTVGMGAASTRVVCGIGSNVFVGTSGKGIYVSSNNGLSWKQENAGLIDLGVFSLGILGDTIFAGSLSNGVWKRSISELSTSVHSTANEIPSEYTLFQNYPNPFNPSTSISYGIPQRSVVKLEVFNVLGQKVATLVECKKEAGNYREVWNATAASGIYFCRLSAVSQENPSIQFTSVRKMLFLK